MNERILNKLKNLTTKSGVYIMKDYHGTVIYVGKAKNLKNRVSQYFHSSQKHSKVEAMVSNIDDFEYFVTLSEMDALELESNLIKKYQPHYNILLKDGKAFPYVAVNLKEDFPRFFITRNVKDKNLKYFGPYFAGLDPKEIIKTITVAFKIRSCKKKLTENKTEKRECLNYSLGLCDGACTHRISKNEYRKKVEQAINFLNGNDTDIQNTLEEIMKTSAEKENFEKALEARDRLKLIEKLKQRIVANLPKNINKDVFYYFNNGVDSVVCSIIVRGGKILGICNYDSNDASLTENETLQAFLNQYYKEMLPPDDLILSHEIDEKLLLNLFEKKVNIITNPKGINKTLLDMAFDNAKTYLEKQLEKNKLEYSESLGAVKVLQEKLGLASPPIRMECYDISHISGTNKVASMVVFKNGKPSKKDYRKFKIKTVKGSNDFACLHETLDRRLTRLTKQDGESFKEKPDLIIIDGGKGQLSACVELLEKHNLSIPMISLAKRIEEVFIPNKSTPILLKPASVELRLLQKIRDEAHRFAITFHRNVRTKMQTHSSLEEIAGLGEKKIAALLKAFGTTENIAKASVEELSLVKGIHKTLAISIFEYFNEEK